jgi:small nuclear ribonucleoprotein (snRNP)-like protein
MSDPVAASADSQSNDEKADATCANGAARVESLSDLVGERVVIDTDNTKLVVGTLEDVNERLITLTDADIHEMQDSRVTSEVYTLEVLKHGVRANRKRVYVRADRVVCVSRLDDVIDY